MTDPKEILPKVSGIVLDEWALAFPDAAPCELQIFEDEGPFLVASLEFHTDYCPTAKAPSKGRVEILSQRSFAELLARNLLGLEESDEVGDDECHDALREMANLVAGHFVSEYFGQDAVVPLRAPVVTPVASRAWAEEIITGDTACYRCEGRPVALHVKVE